MPTENKAPRWMKTVLQAAGIYNMLWGAWVVLFPNHFFDLVGLPRPNYATIWQSVGMIVGVYGLGYYIAAYDPVRHYPIVLVGFLGKLFGPIGLVMYAAQGLLPWAFGWVNLTNDVIWLVPFAIILYHAFRESQAPPTDDTLPSAEALSGSKTQHGDNLTDLSNRGPVLLVALRHFGCTFCKETLADLKAQLPLIRQKGITPVLVHMADEPTAAEYLNHYGLAHLPRISDPACILYRSLGLRRAGFSQVFGWRSWVRGAAATVRGHWVGRLVGDGFQMPGAFLLQNGKVVQAFRHRHASDRVDYCEWTTAENVVS